MVLANASAMAVALPLYSWPLPGAWDNVYDTIKANTDVTFNIIVNPDNGPGSFPPNSDYCTGVETLNSYDNVNVYGYVHTSFTGRSVSEVAADVDVYAEWETYTGCDLHVDGIFVDEAPDDTYSDGVTYMADLASQIKSIMPSGDDSIWTNPGSVVSAEYYEYADVVTAFESTYEYWIDPSRTPIPQSLHNKSSVMIIDYDGSENGITSEAEILISRGFHSAFLFGLGGYQDYSYVWGEFAEELASLAK